MFYTVGQMAKRMGVAASTLRYYDKEGLLPFVERSDGGIRMFKDSDMESLAMIECLKKTGMSIKDIKLFMDLCADGDSTIDARLQLIDRQRDSVTAQIDQLQQTLATLNYKHWFYQTARRLDSLPQKPSRRSYSVGNPCRSQKSLRKVRHAVGRSLCFFETAKDDWNVKKMQTRCLHGGLPAESRPSTFVAVSVAKRSATYVVVRSTVRQANEAKRSKQKRTSGLLVRCWFTTKSRSLREWSTCRESNSDQCRRRASFYPLDYR